MTAIQERPSQIPDLPTVSLEGVTMPEMVVSLRAVQGLPENLFDRDIVQGTSEVLAGNVKRVSAKACEHVVKTDFSVFQEPDCALYFNTVNTTIDFNATNVLPQFPDDDMPTIVMPKQVSIADLPLPTDILFVQPRPPVEQQRPSVEDDSEASVAMGDNEPAEGSKESSLQERLTSETLNLSLQPLTTAQQRVVRAALKRVIRKGSDAYESATATVAMSIPALTGVPDPRRTRRQTPGPAVREEVSWTARARDTLGRILHAPGKRMRHNSNLLQ